MASAKGLEWTFDTVAELYEKARPEYVDALYRRIFDYIAIDESSSVLEIGIGAGEATLPMLRTGCKLTENLSPHCAVVSSAAIPDFRS